MKVMPIHFKTFDNVKTKDSFTVARKKKGGEWHVTSVDVGIDAKEMITRAKETGLEGVIRRDEESVIGAGNREIPMVEMRLYYPVSWIQSNYPEVGDLTAFIDSLSKKSFTVIEGGKD